MLEADLPAADRILREAFDAVTGVTDLFGRRHYAYGRRRAKPELALGAGPGGGAGAPVGGRRLGLWPSLSGAYLPALLVDAVIFMLWFGILMVRPDGLFAQSATESATRRV